MCEVSRACRFPHQSSNGISAVLEWMDAYPELTLHKIHISNSLRSELFLSWICTGLLTWGFQMQMQMQIESLCYSALFFLPSHSLLIVSESECSEMQCMTNLPPASLFLTAGSNWISGTVHTLPHRRAAGGWEHIHLLEKCVRGVCLWKTKAAVSQTETYFCLCVHNGSCLSPSLATNTAACLLNSLYRLMGILGIV